MLLTVVSCSDLPEARFWITSGLTTRPEAHLRLPTGPFAAI